jgi:hypothetical protein
MLAFEKPEIFEKKERNPKSVREGDSPFLIVKRKEL